MAKVRALVDALTGTRPERPGPGGGTWPERPDRNDLVWQSVSVNPGRAQGGTWGCPDGHSIKALASRAANGVARRAAALQEGKGGRCGP